MTDWTSLRYAVVDVEGNGQQPPDLVEVGVVQIIDGVIGEPVSWLVKPPRPITYMAKRIHGIATNDVADAPTFADVAAGVRKALDVQAVVAHNAHIDVSVLQRHLGDWECPEVFDTLKLSKRLAPRQISYRLGALVEAFSLADGLPDGLTPHRATYDVLVTARLFVRLAIAVGRAQSLREQPPTHDDRNEPIELF